MGSGGRIEHLLNEDKRFKKRVNYNLDIHYPRVNNKSVYKDYTTDKPLMEVINISETGICFKSRVPLTEGDFVNFTLTLEDNPSFWCLAEVKWVKKEDELYYSGCEFFTLTWEQKNIIKNFVNKQ
ncbi:PilZ domain-containing protein [Clostridium sp. SYSU_GA19001]|uniref:PilZ domain-containing protein n=1 Tax=Clostridium caldaquaticum TaxID=2940653 RepID=UPI002076E5FE|nr:PilZ domain-containing protein [Clostridium caldaquaticum]MCM8711668.1 PilZ domain-containing protein [Clostridium caldaquaticum]